VTAEIDEGNEITIIENTAEALEEYGTRYGVDYIIISDKHIAALKAGKLLASNNGEYVQLVEYQKD